MIEKDFAVSKNKKYSVVDLFAGCGGMSLGFQNAGFKILAAFDNWKPAIQVYKNNFSHPIYDLDLSAKESVEFVRSLRPDVIIGGPPCQDFSIAGHRNEKLGRADLTISFAKIVVVSKPQWFVMENVDRIRKSNVIHKIYRLFKKAGYGLTTDILDASYCGVPQIRKRFFMVGHLGSRDNFLKSYFDKNKLSKQMTVYDYLGDSLGLKYYFRIPTSYGRRAVFSIQQPSPTIRGVDRPIPKGYKGHPGDPVAITNRLRILTVKERSYIQTFPKTYKFEGTKTDLNQIIGNAVPVKLSEFVANNIIEYSKDLIKDR
jgi:DNA (cytosine-5)-methyltransferase 1